MSAFWLLPPTSLGKFAGATHFPDHSFPNDLAIIWRINGGMSFPTHLQKLDAQLKISALAFLGIGGFSFRGVLAVEHVHRTHCRSQRFSMSLVKRLGKAIDRSG